MPDGRLVQFVDRLERESYSGECYRHQGPGHPPLNAEGARIHGGRWNPKESFPVLYLAQTKAAAAAEFFRLAEKQGMDASALLPRRVYRYSVELSAVLNLTDPQALEAVELIPSDISDDDPTKCQSIGDAAHYAGFEGVMAPSASGVGVVVAVFFDQVKAGSQVEPVDFVDWTTLPR